MKVQRKKSILIVDDDIAHRTMLRILFGSEYEVIEAGNGGTAIEKIREKAFDLVIMDVRMPGISGLEALADIRSRDPELPVVMMTAYSSPDTAELARREGAFDYLTKPFDFDVLRKTISHAFTGRPPGRS